MLLFTLPARLVLGWRLMNRRSEVLVASSSAAPVSHQKAISRFCEIVQQFACVGIVNDGSNRHRKFDRFALPPDLTLFIDVPPEISQSRIASRGGYVELYESDERLRPIYANYLSLVEELKNESEKIVTVDGTGPPQAVAEAILREVLAAVHQP